MQGEKGKRLVSELKTSLWLPPYNETLLQGVQQEINGIFAEIQTLVGDQENGPCIINLNDTAYRNRRAALCYLNYRLNKLEEIRWDVGPSIPSHYVNQLSKDELNYFRHYSNLLRGYSKSLSSALNIDLTLDKQPPKEVLVEVRVKEDYGEVMLPDSGPTNLSRNSARLLSRSEADPLIRLGVVKQTE